MYICIAWHNQLSKPNNQNALKHLIRISIVALAALLSSISATAQSRSNSEEMRQLSKFNKVFGYLVGAYVDEVDTQPLIEKAIESVLQELDPHSSYISAKEMQRVQEQLDGEFSGIGVEFNVVRDTIMVVNTIAGAPAESVGVRPNDRIIAIDGENAVGVKRADVPSKLRGKSGTTVHISVVRHGTEGVLEFDVVRNKIPINTVDAAYQIAKGIGYVKINRFGRTTVDEFQQATSTLGRLNGLILDLRGNGGGLLDQAIGLASHFLPEGSEVVSTEGRAIPQQIYRSRKGGHFTKTAVVVLVDEASASASEIVAGALQDWDRGVIVGRPSFGKGLVQRQVMLNDGSAIRLTTARYHTPTGRVIQRPYENGKREEYYKQQRERLVANGRAADTVGLAELPSYKTLRNGRTVRGGGGITPDVTIEADTLEFTPYLVKLIGKGVLSSYLYDYLDTHRDHLKSDYPTLERFREEFIVSDQILSQITGKASEQGVEMVEEEFSRSKSFLKRQFKALIARNLFSSSAYYEILNSEGDAVLNEGVRIVTNWNEVARPILGY